MSHTFFSRTLLACAALLTLAGCRGSSPDAGGDTSLARDLAEVQLEGADSAAALRTLPKSASIAGAADSAVAFASNGGALASDSPASVEPAHVAHASRSASASAPRRRSGADRRASGSQCASKAASDQTACLIAGVARSNARLDVILREITVAVRRQQRVPPRAPDPAYVGKLRESQAKWVAWRDAECKRRGAASSARLWGAQRAACLSTVTDGRAAELAHILAQVRGR